MKLKFCMHKLVSQASTGCESTDVFKAAFKSCFVSVRSCEDTKNGMEISTGNTVAE
jgi:hypothetical protein